ncbi:FAD-binding oxidoreductase [Streptomyces sp. NPDC002446]
MNEKSRNEKSRNEKARHENARNENARNENPVAAADTKWDWDKLRKQLTGGSLIMRGDREYAAFATHGDNPNPLYTNTPDGIAVCTNTDDVRASVRWASEQGAPLSPVGQQHNYAGYSDIPGGLSIYLPQMNKVAPYDPERNTVVVQAGANIQNLYDALRASNEKNPPFPVVGLCPTVGVGGFLLGGGIGRATRMHGMGADNVLATQLVTADGSLLTCDDTVHSDLYWACRGSAGRNFGVNTSFTLQLHRIEKMTQYKITWAFDKAPDALSRLQEALLADSGNKLYGHLAIAADPGVTEPPVLVADGAYFGPRSEAMDQVLNGVLQEVPPSQTPVIKEGTYWELFDAPTPHALRLWQDDAEYFTVKSRIIDSAGLPHAAMQEIIKIHQEWLKAGAEGELGVTLMTVGGTANTIDPQATAFPYRDALYILEMHAFWKASQNPDKLRQYLHRLYDAMGRYALKDPDNAAFANFPDPDLVDGGQYKKAYYAQNYNRLAGIKRTYDPQSLFTYPEGIRPEDAIR